MTSASRPRSLLRTLAALALAGLATASVGGCRREAPAQPPGLSCDLVALSSAADREGPREVLLFGTPAARPHEAEGFVLPADPPLGESFSWCRRETEIRLSWPSAVARRAVLDLAPYPGLEGQRAEAFLNGQRVGRIELGAGRKRHLLDLPAAAQKAGENVLRLGFEKRSAEVAPYNRRLSGSFYSLTIGEASDAGLAELLPAEAPPLVAIVTGSDVPALVQGGPSVLRYVLRLPERAEVRFTPAIHPASAGRVATLRVTVDGPEGGGARELWRGSVGGAAKAPQRETAVPIPGKAGSLARLSLHVETGAGTRAVWALWKGARVLGDAPALGLETARVAPADDRRADRLRSSTAGVNVVLIVLDAAGARHFGCYGYSRRTTPEIDRLSAEGVVFDQFYSPAVYTLAAMSSVWTSQPPDRHQNVDMRSASLDHARLTLPELLTAQGVHTAGFVANGMAGAAFSFDRGFSEFHEVFTEGGSRGDAFRAVLPPWLDANGGRRFFAYLHFREPHAPYDPPAPFDTLFGPDGPLPRELASQTQALMARDGERPLTAAEIEHAGRLYDGNLAFADQEIGVLRKALESRGLLDRTVVIVTADHGEALHEHGWIGHTSQLYEESVHIPLVVRFPAGKGPAGVRVKGLADLTDIGPTVADLFGVRGRGGSDREFTGGSLLPMLFGAPGKPWVVLRTSGERPKYGLRDGRFKFVFDAATGREELYDLDGDPGERSDLAGRQALRAAHYRQSLQGWLLTLPRQAPAASRPSQLTPKQIENLRALGYVQ